jgi:hypothetical protein
MNINVLLVTYNGMGGHPALSYVGNFLLIGAPASFGPAITTVDIYVHFQSSGPPKEGLESLRERFQKRLTTLPLAWFKRKKHLFEIAYFSRIGTAEELFEREPRVVSLSQFRDACCEIVSMLLTMRRRLRVSDDFCIEAFESFMQERLSELPSRVTELKTVLRDLQAREEQTVAAHSDSN